MRSNVKCALTRAALPLVALALATPALAETIDIGEILVTPNRTKTDKEKVGSTVETVSNEDIKRQSLPTVQEYLAQEPGINIASQGGLGQETTLVVRGADKKYVKTLWNGIDLSDTSATQVQVSPEHLIIGGVNNIEVLKGSQSTLYGADAVAGVIGISTLGDFEEGIRYIVSGEAGSFGTFRGHLGTQVATADGSRFAAGVTGLTTDGISAADARNGNTERDGYDNVTVSLAGEKVLDANLTAFGALLYIDSMVEYDNGFAFPAVDAPNFTDRRQLSGRGGLSFTSDDGRTRTTAAVQINDISRQLNNFDPIFGPYIADYSSSRYKLDWLIEHDLNSQLTLQAGADYERTAFTRTDNYGSNDMGSPWIAGGWAQLIWTPVNDLTLTGAIRQDEHSNFGGFTTWRTTAAYLFQETGTKVRGSAGTGFRAPSPYELFTDPDGPTLCFPNPPAPPLCFGLAQQNPNLKPEESFSWDAGIDQTLLGGALTVSVTYFQLNTNNLIDYMDDVGYTQIPGKTQRNGVETSLRWAVTDWVDLTAAYTYTRSVEANGDRRPRVPQHDIIFGLFTKPAERWNTATTVRIVNDTVDIVDGNLVPLDDYVLVNAKVGYEPINGLEVYVRGENLLDDKYQVVRGYGTPGASVFGGFTMQW